MNFFYELFTNYYIMSAVASWIVAQILKAFTGVFKLQEFSFKALFFGTGLESPCLTKNIVINAIATKNAPNVKNVDLIPNAS